MELIDQLKGIIASLLIINAAFLFLTTDIDPVDSPQWDLYLKLSDFKQSYLHLLAEEDYCKKVRKYREKNPVELQENGLPVPESRVMYTTFGSLYYTRAVFQETQNLVLKEYIEQSSIETLPEVYIPKNITMFYTMKMLDFHRHLKLGKTFLCQGQRYNHIPGNVFLDSKKQNQIDFRLYAKLYKDRTHCFDPWKIIPFSYILSDQSECTLFIKSLEDHLQNPKIK